MKVVMRPVYLPSNFVGGVFAGPVAWECEIDAPQTIEPKPLLSIAEAATFLGMSRTVVNEMTNCGDLPAVLVRRRKKVRRDDLDAFVKHGPRKMRRKAAA
jgi:excisionase family DNA binding protein